MLAVDFKGGGVEANHRGMSSNSGGYHDGGEPFVHNDFMTATGGPYYQSYPLQMFDRKLRPMSTVYVGLVATKRLLTDKYRKMLLRQTDGITTIPSEIESFYTFHFAYFSDNQAWTDNAGISAPTPSAFANSTAAEPATKKAKLHYEDAAVGGTYDPYTGMSQREWGGLVGAWKVGKVLDIAAQVKDRYRGGPVDTAERITVNVDIEFLDWRALRRALNVPEIGSRVPGAAPWLESLDYTQEWNQDKEVELKTRAARNPTGGDASVLFDQGLVMQWPTAYSQVPLWDPGELAALAHLRQTVFTIISNMPTDPMTIDEAMRSGDGLVAHYDDTDMTTRKTYLTRRAELGRAKLFKQKDGTPVLWIPKLRDVAGVVQPVGAKERWQYEADVGGFTKPVFYDLTVDQRGFSQQGLSVPATSTAAEGRPPAMPPVPHEFDTLWSPEEHLDNWMSEVARSKNYRLMGQNDNSFNGRGPAGLRQRVITARKAYWASSSPTPDEARALWVAFAAFSGVTASISMAKFLGLMDTDDAMNGPVGEGINPLVIAAWDGMGQRPPMPTQVQFKRYFGPYVTGTVAVGNATSKTLVESVFRFIASLDVDSPGLITEKALTGWLRPYDVLEEINAIAARSQERTYLGAAGQDIELARDIAAPISDASMPTVVVPPAPRAPAVPKGKGRATGASASAPAAAPPKAKPKPPAPKPSSTAAAPPKAAASVASVVMAPPGAASAPSATPTATAAVAVGSVSAAAPTRARRAVEASTDVFNSIFGATASTAASAAEDPAPSPSAQSDGSESGAAGAAAAARGGRVRRAKDGR